MTFWAASNRRLRAEDRTQRTGTIDGQAVTFFARWLVDHGRAPVLEELTRSAVRGPRTGRALDRYLRLRAKRRYRDVPSLFLGERGPLTTDGVRECWGGPCGAAGIGHAHPHQLRHTNAHDFLLAGGQERDLKRLMGWSSDAMLERYGASAADARAAAATRTLNRGDRV